MPIDVRGIAHVRAAYRAMATHARYRARASEPGHRFEIDGVDESTLSSEANGYAGQWAQQENQGLFGLKLTEDAFRVPTVYALEALRLLHDEDHHAEPEALALLEMAIDEIKSEMRGIPSTTTPEEWKPDEV